MTEYARNFLYHSDPSAWGRVNVARDHVGRYLEERGFTPPFVRPYLSHNSVRCWVFEYYTDETYRPVHALIRGRDLTLLAIEERHHVYVTCVFVSLYTQGVAGAVWVQQAGIKWYEEGTHGETRVI